MENSETGKGSFLESLLAIVGAHDIYGTYRQLSEEQKLSRFFLITPEERAEMESCGKQLEKSKAQTRLFFQAMALAIEQRTGRMVSSIVELNDDGCGRALLYSGRLVLLCKSIRGASPFAFVETERASKDGEKYIASSIEWLDKYPQISLL